LGTPLIATAILAGGTALGVARAGHHNEAELFPTTAGDTTAGDRPTQEPPARNLERQPFSASPSPSASPSASPARKVVSTGTCAASFYWEPQGTASGETFNPEALTAAHKTLPFNTQVRVTNPNNGKSVTVRINDRGPYVGGRCLDLSRAAFRTIASLETGVLKSVRYEVLSGLS
jgi:rare lipoprotein A